MQRINIRNSVYAQNVLYLDGMPYSLAAFPYCEAILDCPAEISAVMSGRQVSKSTLTAASIVTEQTAIPFYKSLYIAPRNDQVMQFSRDRLSHFIQYSPAIQNGFIDGTVQQQVKAKGFLNGSATYLRSSYLSADGVRGISANSIYIDEVQDIIYDNIPIIEECSARKDPRKVMYTGTPKTTDNTLSHIWNHSSQNYWAVKCEGCNFWNVPLGISNIGNEGLICSRCGKSLNAITGIYASTFPERPVKGFHISQLMIYGCPGTNLPWSRVMDKYNNPMYSMALFHNECLGFPFDSGAKLLTEADLRRCCIEIDTEPTYMPYYSLDRQAHWEMRQVAAGIDWGVNNGNTHTAVSIGGMLPTGKLKVMSMKKYPLDQDPVEQVKAIAADLRKAGVVLICADRGGGHLHAALLRKEYPSARLIEIEYKAKFLPGMAYNDKSHSWITDRTRSLAGLVLDIKMSLLEFPPYMVCEPCFTDFLTLSCKYNDNLRAYQINRQTDVNDDVAHSTNYLRLAAKKFLPRPRARQHDLEDAESVFGPMPLPDDDYEDDEDITD